MAKWRIRNVRIAGVSACVPENVVATGDMGIMTPEEVETFDRTVGIRHRHIAPDTVCASDMCEKAADSLLEQLGWERGSIDVLIFESVTGDYRTGSGFPIPHSVSICRWGVAAVCMPLR